MQSISDPAVGLKRLVGRCRDIFRQPENLNHYTEEDFKDAERKFIHFCLKGSFAWTSSDQKAF